MTQARPRPAVPPVVALTVGVAAVSSASIFIRLAQQEAPSLVIAAARLMIASFLLAPIAWARYRAEYNRLTVRDWALAALSGIFLALHFATWISSLEYTTVASSVVLVSASPLFVALASWLFLRERITRVAVGGLVVALAGSAIIGLSDTAGTARHALLGDLLAFVGAATVAGYLLIGRRLRAKLSVVPYITIVYGTAALTLAVMVGAARQTLVGYSPMTYIWFALLALGPQLLGHSSFNWALAHLPATFVSIATLGEPIGSTLLALIILGEVPAPIKLVGAALILAGILIASRSTSE